MKNKGFTLIELMIVVAIIAIIAAIAIPNLLRSRMAANEGAAVASCKAFASAQDIYRRTDWDKDTVAEYSRYIGNIGGTTVVNSLYFGTDTTEEIKLVDRAFANAEGDQNGGTTVAFGPKAGYVFSSLTTRVNAAGTTGTFFQGTTANMTLGYALSAVPAQYDSTGRNTFIIDNTGTVFQQDRGTASTGHVSQYDSRTGWSATE
jgi:type IV pilus assembly protein PilA